MKTERLSYLTEMTAATTAVSIFIAVYAVGFVQWGWVVTLFFAWLPAAFLAWFGARAIRAGAQLAFDLRQSSWASFADDDELVPIETRRRPRSHRGR